MATDGMGDNRYRLPSHAGTWPLVTTFPMCSRRAEREKESRPIRRTRIHLFGRRITERGRRAENDRSACSIYNE